MIKVKDIKVEGIGVEWWRTSVAINQGWGIAPMTWRSLGVKVLPFSVPTNVKKKSLQALEIRKLVSQ